MRIEYSIIASAPPASTATCQRGLHGSNAPAPKENNTIDRDQHVAVAVDHRDPDAALAIVNRID